MKFFTLLAVAVNHLLPGQAIPLWIVAAHVVAFGLIALIVANTQSSLEQAVARQVRHADLERMAYTDELTGLANRNRLYTGLDEAMLRLQHTDVGFAVLIIDLDGFKPINDRYGHHAGDALLRILGARLKSSMKAGDLAARFGGDEFVVILADCTDAAKAISVAERLLRAMTQPLSIRLSEDTLVTVEVGASIGVAHSESGATNSEALLKQADQALYAAKAAGKARVVAYDSGGATTAGGAVDR